ncbi:MAG: hypothetical protein ACRD2R_06750 [Terriglobales bacterium]
MTPKEIDARCSVYKSLLAERDDLEQQIAEHRKELAALVTRWGSTPPRAHKSVRVLGDEFQITLSWSSPVTVNPLGALRLQAACMKAGRPGLFKRLLRRRFIYLIAEGAQQVLDAHRRGRAPRSLRALFSRALVHEARTMNLEVEWRKPEAA